MPWKTITAMVCITVLTAIALLTGHDGALFLVGTNLITGIAGFSIGRSSVRGAST